MRMLGKIPGNILKRKTRGWPYDVSVNKNIKQLYCYVQYKIYNKTLKNYIYSQNMNWITDEQQKQ